MPKIVTTFMKVSQRIKGLTLPLGIVKGRGAYPLPLFAVDVNGVTHLTVFTTDDADVFFHSPIKHIARWHAAKMEKHYYTTQDGRGIGALYRLPDTKVIAAYSDGDYRPTSHPFTIIQTQEREAIKMAVLHALYGGHDAIQI